MCTFTSRITFHVEVFQLITSILTVLLIILQINESQLSNSTYNDISCHNEVIKNDLISADGKMQFFSEKSIFFLEVSCQDGIKSRQACSIESAAVAHPNWQINVLFAGPVPVEIRRGEIMSALRKYTNIKFYRIHVAKFSQNTPLEELIANGILQRSPCQLLHSSDVLRLITLYRWGGVYLDLDVIVVRSFDTLGKNWVARETDNEIGSAYLALSRDKLGRHFADAAIRELGFNLKEGSLEHNAGPLMLYVLRKYMCSTHNVARMSAGSCKGFAVYHQKYFNPIRYSKWYYFFRPGEITLRKVYAIHTWGVLSENSIVSYLSPFAKLAKQFCPKIYGLFNDSNYWRT